MAKRYGLIKHRTLLVLFLVFLVFAGTLWLMVKNQSSLADVTTTQEEYVPGQILVKFKDNVTKEKKDKFFSDYKLKKKSEISQIGVNVFELPGTGTEKEYEKAFKLHKDVEFAELDYIYEANLIPNDPEYLTGQWFLPKMGGPVAWDVTTGSANIVIAIVDTGVDGTHPDLAAKMVPGWNIYDNNSNTADVYGHGTGVAGNAAAIGNNGIGVASPNFVSKIMPVRVSGTDGHASSSTIAPGIQWAADHGARVIDSTYAAYTSSTVMSAAKYAYSKGILVTMASGNSGGLDPTPDSPYAIVVGGTDQSDSHASFSTYGNMVDVAAPSVSLRTTAKGGGYWTASGTSGAAPITAGVISMIISANPSLSVTQVEKILKETVDDVGTVGWDQYTGWGRINLEKAVKAAKAGPAPDTTPPTAVFTSPANGANVSGTINVTVDARDNIGVSTVNLTIDGSDQGAPDAISGSVYTFSINTNAYSNGSHILKATATDTSSNTAAATISVNISNTLDSIPPNVSITTPSNGTVLKGSKITISVSATDNVSVSRVEIFIDGVLVKSLISTPYTYSWNIRKITSGSHTIEARAYDAKGNMGTSTITVTK